MKGGLGRSFDKWKQSARKLKAETYALYLAYRHPHTPWYAKAFAGLVIAYAFSPIDLIPDFIPVLGYFDDLLLVPLGIAIAIRMIPASVMVECRARAEIEMGKDKQTNWFAAATIIVIWLTIAALFVVWLTDLLK